MRAILAIDQGTTNSKASPGFSEKGARHFGRGSASCRHSLSAAGLGRTRSHAGSTYPSARRVDACLKAVAADLTVEAVAISNQRESVTAWDAATGDALGPVVSWQCRRTATGLRTSRLPKAHLDQRAGAHRPST
jgi:glycerol kinase